MSTHRNVRLLALHNFLSDLRPYFAIAVVYFSHITGSYAQAMLVFSMVMFSAAALELPTGIFSDMIGRKGSIIVGSAACVAALLLYTFGYSLEVLLVGAFFEGMSRSFFSGNNDALLYDSLRDEGKEDTYAQVLGKTSSMFQLALAMGALIAGLLGTMPLRLIVFISIIPQILAFFVGFFFREPHHYARESTNIYSHMREALVQFQDNSRLRFLTFGSAIKFGIGEAKFYFEPAFIALLWPPWGLGISRMLQHGFGWLSYWFSGWFVRRHSATLCLFASAGIVSILGFIAYGFPSVFSPLLLALMSLFFGLFMVSQGTLLQKEFTDSQRATMGSIGSLFGSLLFAISSVLLGFLADVLGPAKALLIAEIVLALFLYPVYWRLFKHK